LALGISLSSVVFLIGTTEDTEDTEKGNPVCFKKYRMSELRVLCVLCGFLDSNDGGHCELQVQEMEISAGFADVTRDLFAQGFDRGKFNLVAQAL